MSSISQRMVHQIKTRAFQQLFINYARCLRNHNRDIGRDETKQAVGKLVDKAVRRGLISNTSFKIVSDAIDNLYEMSQEELLINETLNLTVLEGIIGNVDDLSQHLTSDEDLESILKYRKAEKDYLTAKEDLTSVIKKYAEEAIEQFFDFFNDELKSGIGI